MIPIRRPFFSFILLSSLLIAGLSKGADAQIQPDFTIRFTNGQLLSSAKLPARPTIIIVFSPDCGHCKTMMNEIFKKIRSFESAQIVMATFVPDNEIVAFEKHYQTAKFPNIYVGRDVPGLYFQRFYKLTSTPFTALYDKNKKLIASYNDEKSVDKLIRQLQLLK